MCLNLAQRCLGGGHGFATALESVLRSEQASFIVGERGQCLCKTIFRLALAPEQIQLRCGSGGKELRSTALLVRVVWTGGHVFLPVPGRGVIERRTYTIRSATRLPGMIPSRPG